MKGKKYTMKDYKKGNIICPDNCKHYLTCRFIPCMVEYFIKHKDCPHIPNLMIIKFKKYEKNEKQKSI